MGQPNTWCQLVKVRLLGNGVKVSKSLQSPASQVFGLPGNLLGESIIYGTA